MLCQRLASCPPYEPGRGRRVAHQCPGVRTPLLREPRSPEGNGKGSRKEEMGEERGSRGEQHLCSLVPSAVEVFSWPPGHWPASSPVSLWGTLSFTHHSAIKLCAFPQFYLWLFPLICPSVQNTPSKLPVQAPAHHSPWQSDLPNDQPAQGVATMLSVYFPSHPRLCCPSPFLSCAQMVSISLPSLEYELSEKRDLVVLLSRHWRHWLPG